MGRVSADGEEVGRQVDEESVDGRIVEAGRAHVGDHDLEDVVDGVALDAGPAECAAVRVGRHQELVEVAPVGPGRREVVHALLAGSGPNGGCRAPSRSRRCRTRCGRPARRSTRAWSCRGWVRRRRDRRARDRGQALLVEDRDGRLGVVGEVREDRHTGRDGCARGRPVDALVEIGHPAATADADLDHAGACPVLPMPTAISWMNCWVR